MLILGRKNDHIFRWKFINQKRHNLFFKNPLKEVDDFD